MLISSAAWAHGFHGPNGEWERCTQNAGLPLLVCNRTGGSDPRLHVSRECRRQERGATPDLVVGPLNGLHCRLESPPPKFSDTPVPTARLVK